MAPQHRLKADSEEQLWFDETGGVAKLARLYANLAKHHAQRSQELARDTAHLVRIAYVLLGLVLVVQVGGFAWLLWRR